MLETTPSQSAPAGARATCLVDGDTGWEGGLKWRLSAVDAPEITNPGCAWRATIRMRLRIASLNFVPEAFLRFSRQVTRCRASHSCSFRLGSPTAAREDAVKVGRRATSRLAPPSTGHTLTEASSTPCS